MNGFLSLLSWNPKLVGLAKAWGFLGFFCTAPLAAGFDKMTLENDQTVEVTVQSYANGILKVQLPNGQKHEGLISEVKSIQFELGMGDADDVMTLKSGQTIPCAVISYENGILSVRLPNGDKQTGKIDQIASLQITPARLQSGSTPAGRSRSSSHASEPEQISLNGSADNPPRLEFAVEKERVKLFNDPGQYSPNDRWASRLTLENRDLSRTLENGHAWFYSVYRNKENTQEYVLVNREHFQFPMIAPGESFSWVGEAPASSVSGNERSYMVYDTLDDVYHGWICLILDEANRVVTVGASHESWKQSAEKIVQLGIGDRFNYQLKITKTWTGP